MPNHLIEKQAVANYIIDLLTAYHKNKLERKGFDFFFTLSIGRYW